MPDNKKNYLIIYIQLLPPIIFVLSTFDFLL